VTTDTALIAAYDDARISLKSVMVFGVLLGCIKVSLLLLGFNRTVRLVESLTNREHWLATADRRMLVATAATVATAGAFYPGRARCLEQSLALHAALRFTGMPSRLRIGVEPYRFQAHAWVEHDRQPIWESRERLKAFVAFPEVAP
jgi:hypothetical protein